MKKVFKWLGLAVFTLLALMVILGPKSGGKVDGPDSMEAKFIVSNPFDLSQISSISKFRSCMGHDYSDYNTKGEKEKLRSMKHYLTPVKKFENSSNKLFVFAPFDGKIRSVKTDGSFGDRQRGRQVWLEPEKAPNWFFVFFHLDLLEGFEEGSKIKAGELIGYGNVENAANFDMAVKASNGIRGPNIIDSPFRHMTVEVLEEYEKVGVAVENIIVSKEYRDANVCPVVAGTESKNDTMFPSGDDPDDHVRLSR